MVNFRNLFRIEEGIPRPGNLVKNPYIGRDGRDYYSPEALEAANKEYNERMFRKIPEKIR